MIIGLPIGQLLNQGIPANSSPDTGTSATGSSTEFNSLLGSIVGDQQNPMSSFGMNAGGNSSQSMSVAMPLDLNIENITGITGNGVTGSISGDNSTSPLSSFLQLINQITGTQNSVLEVNIDLESLSDEQKSLLSDLGLDMENLSGEGLSLVIDQSMFDSIMEQASSGEGSWSVPIQAILPDQNNPATGSIPDGLFLNIVSSIDSATGELNFGLELSLENLNTNEAGEMVQSPSLFDILFSSVQENAESDQDEWKTSIASLANSLRQVTGAGSSVDNETAETVTSVVSGNAVANTETVKSDESVQESAAALATGETGETEEEDDETDPIDALLRTMAEILAGKLEESVESGDIQQAARTVTLMQKLVKLDSLSDEEKVDVLNELADLLNEVDLQTVRIIPVALPDMLNSLENGETDLASFIAELEKIDSDAASYLKSSVGNSETSSADIRQLLTEYYTAGKSEIDSIRNLKNLSVNSKPNLPVAGSTEEIQSSTLLVPSHNTSEDISSVTQPKTDDQSPVSGSKASESSVPETNRELVSFLRSIAAQLTATETSSPEQSVTRNSETAAASPEITATAETVANGESEEAKNLVKDIAEAISELGRKLEENISSDEKQDVDGEKKLSMFLKSCLDILKESKENQNKLTVKDMNNILARAAELSAATGQVSENAPMESKVIEKVVSSNVGEQAPVTVSKVKSTVVSKDDLAMHKVLDKNSDTGTVVSDTETKKTESANSTKTRFSVNTEKKDSATAVSKEIAPEMKTKSDSQETKVAKNSSEKVSIPVKISEISQDSPQKAGSDKVKLSSTASAVESGRASENNNKIKSAEMSATDKEIAKDLKVTVESLEGKSGDMNGQLKQGKGQADTILNNKTDTLSGTGKVGDASSRNNSEMSKTQQQQSSASRYIDLANQNEMVNKISRQARIIRVPGSSEINMHLKPESLGNMRIQLRVDSNHNVAARIQVENHEARQMVEHSLARLKDSLADQGLKVDKVGVDVRGDQQQSNQGQNFSSNFGSEQNRNGRNAGWKSDQVGVDGSQQNEKCNRTGIKERPRIQYPGMGCLINVNDGVKNGSRRDRKCYDS